MPSNFRFPELQHLGPCTNYLKRRVVGLVSVANTKTIPICSKYSPYLGKRRRLFIVTNAPRDVINICMITREKKTHSLFLNSPDSVTSLQIFLRSVDFIDDFFFKAGQPELNIAPQMYPYRSMFPFKRMCY